MVPTWTTHHDRASRRHTRASTPVVLAARLLRETDQPLGEIASEVGYESEFALSRAFKRSRDVAPGRYRATHQRRSLDARDARRAEPIL